MVRRITYNRVSSRFSNFFRDHGLWIAFLLLILVMAWQVNESRNQRTLTELGLKSADESRKRASLRITELNERIADLSTQVSDLSKAVATANERLANLGGETVPIPAADSSSTSTASAPAPSPSPPPPIEPAPAPASPPPSSSPSGGGGNNNNGSNPPPEKKCTVNALGVCVDLPL